MRYLHEHYYARSIPRPHHKWVKRGSRPTQGYYGGHLRRNVVGAVEPATGRLVSLIVAHCNTEVFQVFLDTMAEEIPPEDGKQLHLVLESLQGVLEDSKLVRSICSLPSLNR